MCCFNEIIIVLVIPCLAAIMTEDTTGKGTTYLWTLNQTWRNMSMGQKTVRPCPSRVSEKIAVKWH